jgi:hypothetical protein
MRNRCRCSTEVGVEAMTAMRSALARLRKHCVKQRRQAALWQAWKKSLQRCHPSDDQRRGI